MAAVLHVLKQRWFIALVGLILLSLLIWFAGPFLAFADHHPLDSGLERGITIFILFVIWLGWLQLKFVLAWRATHQLAEKVAEQPAPAGGGETNAEAAQLKARFTEAITALRKGSKRGTSLYDLPWFVIIGPPGSGKTTALVNSGLSFPLAQKFGKGAVRGVGGTRNCDWWFTDDAVFLDTAGRYTTQDSDQAADSAGWAEFLRLLKNYRPRRPVNGVIVALSLSDLMTQGEQGVAANVVAVRSRLEELYRHLKVTLPVYLMFTKADMAAGFTEFFDDLNAEGREQVWGVTFPIEATQDGSAAQSFTGEFDALLDRLNARLLGRMNQETDPQRRPGIFAFPSQMSALRAQLGEFVTQTFVSTKYEGRLLLRGVYFTSGTQEGTPIDRMMGALARNFGLDPQAVASATGRGRAYFIQRLFREVMFPESGLASVDRRSALRHAAISAASYIGLTAAAILAVVAIVVSWSRNAGYLDDVGKVLANYPAGKPAITSPGAAPALASLLPRLNALWAVVQEAEKYKGHVPLSMRFGLYQGKATADSARDAYVREMSAGLLPIIATHLHTRLVAEGADAGRLFEYLKTYLMLGQPEHLDRRQLTLLTGYELARLFPDAPEVRDLLLQHFGNLVGDEARLRPLSLDDAVIARARESLRSASLPVLAYNRIKLEHDGDVKRALHLDVATGLGSEKVLARRSGKPLGEPVPALYTRPVFEEVVGTGAANLVKSFTQESWVMGDAGLDVTGATRLALNTLLVYEQDYARYWRELLNDIVLVKPTGLSQLREQLGLLSGPTSPLRALLVVVTDNTNLTKQSVTGAVASDVAEDTARDLTKSELGRTLLTAVGAAADKAPEKPGARVTAEFRPIHELVEGAAGETPIDGVLAKVAQVNQAVQAMGSGIGQTGALSALSKSGAGDAMSAVQDAAKGMPEPVASLVQDLGGQSAGVAAGSARTELSGRLTEQVARDCGSVARGRYPFSAGSASEVPVEDFGRLFGFGGVFDKFFQDNLVALVDTTRSPWQPREGAAALGVGPGMLNQFRSAQTIRDMFFKPGAQAPEMRLGITPDSLDAQSLGVTLEIHGARLEYRHGPVQSWNVQWPGGPTQTAAITFQDASGATPNLAFQGAWALFRLLDKAKITPAGDNFNATYELGGHTARFVLVPSSLRNPLRGMAALRQFSCGG